MQILPDTLKRSLSGLKRHLSGLRLTEFNQVKFDAATAWLCRSKAGIVLLNIASLEVLALVSVLKKIKGLVRGQSDSVVPPSVQEILTLLPKPQASVRVLMIVEASIPQCLHYRVKQKLEQLEICGFYVEWYDWSDIAMLQQAIYRFDLVLFYRVPGYAPILELMQQAKAQRKLVLYDIDDLIFDRQQLSQVFQQTTDQLSDKDLQGILNGADLYKAAIKTAHYGIASTPALQQELAKLVEQGRSFLLPNGLDQAIESLATQPKLPHADERVCIFYGSGTKTHDEDFALIAQPLMQLLEKYPNAQLVLAGKLTVPTSLADFSDRIQRLPSMDFQSYLSCLQHSDIAIAPLQAGIFADCKSEIKWLEAACLSVPAVVSKTACYADVVEHGETGFLAANSDDWFDALSCLLESAELRAKIGSAAKQAVIEQYSSAAMAEKMRTMLAEVQSQAAADRLMQAESTPAKKRLLIANVLFPPHAIGGATSVVVQSIQGLLKQFGQDYEVEVLTTEMSDAAPYSLREYEYAGVKVTVIRVPSHSQLESREFDPEIFKLCLAWLPQNRPDLIHFHSMQRLTAAPLQAAQELQIPYCVTVHDAWWISSHQFLLDSEDQLVQQPQRNPLIAATTAENAGETIQRTQYLAKQLNAAKHIFAVSEFQAELYRNNGFQQTVVLKNGVSIDGDQTVKPNRQSDSLVIGYLGGISAHKGYHFLQQIVERGVFNHLHFTLVDLFKPTTFQQESQWGQSKVTVLGKQPAQHIREFYQQIDVLIAPSIWPESFGLVSREAALQGVWVVAADAGGLAEDIIENKTGFAFPMNDAKACEDILLRLNEQWQHYRDCPPDQAISEKMIFSQTEHNTVLASYYSEIIKSS